MSQRTNGRDMSLIAIFAGVTAILGLAPAIVTPISPVPITLQSMGVAVTGNILGGRRALLSQLLFITLVAIGMPLLAGGRGGIGVFLAPSAGFIIGYPVVAFLIGLVTARLEKLRVGSMLVINLIFGVGVLYVFGVVGMMLLGNLDIKAALLATVVYLPGDLVKMIIAAVVANGVHKASPGILAAPTVKDE